MQMKACSTVVCALLLGLWSPAALALDESMLSTARELGEQGLAAYDAGRYDEAAQKLLQAYGAVKVPTFARNAARALAKQGKLVAAAELYLQATRLEPNELWRGDLQQQAQQESAVERAALLARIARLQIALEGASSQDTSVTVDNEAVPAALVGADQFADPGLHHVVGKHGARTVDQSIELREGEHGQVVLRFTVAREPAPTLAPPVPPAQAAPTSVKQSNLRRTVGWVSLGVGAAGVTVGAVTGIALLVKQSHLHADGCAGSVCTKQSEASGVNSFNSLRPVASVGFIAGGVLAATGVALLWWPERHESQSNVGVSLGPGSLAVQGRF